MKRFLSDIRPFWRTPAEIEWVMNPIVDVWRALGVVCPKLAGLFSRACEPSHDLPGIAAVRCGLCWLLQRLADLWSDLENCKTEFEHQVTPHEALLIKQDGGELTEKSIAALRARDALGMERAVDFMTMAGFQLVRQLKAADALRHVAEAISRGMSTNVDYRRLMESRDE